MTKKIKPYIWLLEIFVRLFKNYAHSGLVDVASHNQSNRHEFYPVPTESLKIRGGRGKKIESFGGKGFVSVTVQNLRRGVTVCYN